MNAVPEDETGSGKKRLHSNSDSKKDLEMRELGKNIAKESS